MLLRRRFLILVPAFILVSIFAPQSLAIPEMTASVVRGRVVDQNQAVVPGASINVVNTATRTAVQVSSDPNGEFKVELEPGLYELEVKAAGFNSLTRKLRVSPDDKDVIELSLEIASATASVTVTDGGEYQTATVFSATKTATLVRDLPQSISIVGKQQIADQLLTNIGDLARYQPGITSHQGENNRDQLIIRGQTTTSDFFVDGVRDDAQYQRDLYNLERIEVLRGPNALAFGRGGGGGVINRVPKEAESSPVYEAAVQAGSYGHRRGTFDINQPLGDRFAFRVNGLGEVSDSFRDFVDVKRFGLNPTVTIKPDLETRITLAYDLFRDRHVADRGITSVNGLPADVPASTYYGNPSDSKVRLDAGIFSAGVERVFGSLIFRDRFVYGSYDRFYQNYVPGSVNPDRTLVSISA